MLDWNSPIRFMGHVGERYTAQRIHISGTTDSQHFIRALDVDDHIAFYIMVDNEGTYQSNKDYSVENSKKTPKKKTPKEFWGADYGSTGVVLGTTQFASKEAAALMYKNISLGPDRVIRHFREVLE